MENKNRPLALLILDGWGYSPRIEGNAIASAHTPNYDEICRSFPMTKLSAAGIKVGQRADEAGNSEVGHLNIGTGRVAQTETSRIKAALADGAFMDNAVLNDAFIKAADAGTGVHLIGLLSDAGVHSSAENLFALLRLARKHGLKKVFVHCILDGLDVPPRTADVFVEALEIKLADIGLGQIATMCGRYFAMDNAENWERTARAFTMLVHAEGERSNDAVGSIRNSFLRGIADEFISPIIMETPAGEPVAKINNGDLLVYFNHRADAMRQLVRSVSIADSANASKPIVETVCLTEYDSAFNLPVAFPAEAELHVLTEVLSEKGIPNLKITESARAPHLINFFDGGNESKSDIEQEIVLPTQKSVIETAPESQSFKITDKFMRGIESFDNGVFVVNFPAADLVAASGDIKRTVAAVQYIDTCIGSICERVRQNDGIVMITSTHGNCEEMIDLTTGEAKPSNTSNPVPFHYIDDRANGIELRDSGSLADIAPTILAALNLEIPDEMTGKDLRML